MGTRLAKSIRFMVVSMPVLMVSDYMRFSNRADGAKHEILLSI